MERSDLWGEGGGGGEEIRPLGGGDPPSPPLLYETLSSDQSNSNSKSKLCISLVHASTSPSAASQMSLYTWYPLTEELIEKVSRVKEPAHRLFMHALSKYEN